MSNDNGDDKITPHAKGCRVMIFRKQKMPGHEGPGKLGLTQWEMYLRHGVGATKILI